jgi:outer membrane protein OmpU
MKKILLATTMLAGTAGFAAAEVTVSGFAEMGVLGGSAAETQFHQDVEVTFTMAGETDGGLSFGTAIDLDETNVPGGGHGGTSVFVSGTFGKITMGDTDGGFDWALTEVGMGSALADDHTTHAGYNGNGGLDGTFDGQVVRYEYSFGQVGIAASAEIDDAGVGDTVLGLGATYDAGVAKIGLGYQNDGVDTIVGVSVSGEASGVKYALNYSDLDSAGTHMGVGVGYTSGALMVAANYGVYESVAGVKADGYGLVANYDLGGGAVFQAGYGNGEGANTWSAGLALSF